MTSDKRNPKENTDTGWRLRVAVRTQVDGKNRVGTKIGVTAPSGMGNTFLYSSSGHCAVISFQRVKYGLVEGIIVQYRHLRDTISATAKSNSGNSCT